MKEEARERRERRKTTTVRLLIITIHLYQWNDEDDRCLLLRAEQSIARYNIAGV